MKPGIHDTGADAYHQDPSDTPSLSASIARTLIDQSPAHAWIEHPKLNPDWQPHVDQKFDVGTAAHALLLEGRDAVEVIDATDWRTNAAKDARDAAREAGKIPMLPDQWEQVQEMVDAATGKLEAHTARPKLLDHGNPEQTLIWEENGVTCRALVDWLHDDMSAIDDLKTSSRTANPETWCRTTMWSIGADLQAAFYLRGLRALTGLDAVFRFVIVETYPPYALSVVTPGPDVLALADAKVDLALATWKRCLERDEWPAYPSQVATAELPPWMEAQWWERFAGEAEAA